MQASKLCSDLLDQAIRQRYPEDNLTHQDAVEILDALLGEFAYCTSRVVAKYQVSSGIKTRKEALSNESISQIYQVVGAHLIKALHTIEGTENVE